MSKAALDKMVEAWRAEHPTVGFTRVVMGDSTSGEGESRSEFALGWDMELANELLPIWLERKYVTGALIEVDELVRVLDAVLRTGPSAIIPSVTVAPRPR